MSVAKMPFVLKSLTVLVEPGGRGADARCNDRLVRRSASKHLAKFEIGI